MGRILLQYLLPLLLPFLVYAVYVLLIRGHTPGWLGRAPWAILGGIGLVLAAASLVTWTLLTGSPTSETYVPPRFEGGRVVPSETLTPEAAPPRPATPTPAPQPWE